MDDYELSLPICTTCGTQFAEPFLPNLEDPLGCRICAEPRQYVLPAGLTTTTLKDMQSGKFSNKIVRLEDGSNIWEIFTEPKFAIGQRTLLIETPAGNVLWDMVTLLDKETIDFINSKGGIKAIIISHPHYYTTHGTWARTFNCKVYIAPEDKEWLSRAPENDGVYEWLKDVATEVLPGSGITAIKVGGHFPGSLCLHLKEESGKQRLFIADSLVTVPSAKAPVEYPLRGVASYAFMWSIPNMIPLTPHAIKGIWDALAPFEFDYTHGAFHGSDITGKDVRNRVLYSAKIAVRAMGWEVNQFFG